MKIILLKDVKNLGHKYDVKEVASGHALNMLIPRGDAVAATPGALKQIETQKAKSEGEKKVRADLLAKNVKDLDGLKLTVKVKANDKGHLFAGMHKDAVLAEIKKQTELQLDPTFLMLDQPIKETGEHVIEVKGGGKSAKFKLVVEGL